MTPRRIAALYECLLTALRYSHRSMRCARGPHIGGVAYQLKMLLFTLGYHDPNNFSKINSTDFVPCNSIVDLGVRVQSNLKSSLHCTTFFSKASARYKQILKSFLSRDPHILTRAFVTYVRPVLEYYILVWSPSC